MSSVSPWSFAAARAAVNLSIRPFDQVEMEGRGGSYGCVGEEDRFSDRSMVQTVSGKEPVALSLVRERRRPGLIQVRKFDSASLVRTVHQYSNRWMFLGLFHSPTQKITDL